MTPVQRTAGDGGGGVPVEVDFAVDARRDRVRGDFRASEVLGLEALFM
jgi:hypothetical protein